MVCCARRRSPNDALLDSETGQTFCGTCWQKWIDDQSRISLALPSEKSNTNTAVGLTGRGGDFYHDDDDSIGQLDGIEHEGELYLASKTKMLVFETTRSADGRLLCVGTLKASGNGQTAVKLYNWANKEQDQNSSEFPFEADANDHCETPFEAYQDLAPYLDFLASQVGKKSTTLRIWDPYYCAGGVKRNLGRLGFHNVHNECQDFYSLVKHGRIPEYDCIVTNPPYSTEPFDHVERLIDILCSQKKPWFVVQPNYVYVKPFWEKLTSRKLAAPRPFFLTPTSPRKYKYKTPSGMRAVSAQQLKTSPFVSMWYCWMGSKHTEALYRWVCKANNMLPLTIACTEYFLPDNFKDSNDKTRRKPRKNKKRKDSGTGKHGVQKSHESLKSKSKRRRNNV